MLFDSEFLRKLEKIKLVLKRRKVTGFQGKHSSKELGTGLEFSDFRQYLPGDDYRYIDWNLYSRLEQLFLKLFTEEREIMLYILIDNSKSMGFGEPKKLETALKIAGILGYTGLVSYDRVGAGFFSDQLGSELKPGKGKKYVYKLFDFLEHGQETGKTNFNKVLKIFNYKYKKPGTVIIISDLMDKKGYQKGLHYLLGNNWGINLIQIISQEEMEPSLKGDFRLIDSEDGNIKETSINQNIINAYKKKLQDYNQKIEQFSHRYGISYLKMVSTAKFEDLILNLHQNNYH